VRRLVATVLGALVVAVVARGASVGDPQLKTDHDWYPGELSCSTFARMFAEQKRIYEREVGRTVNNDEDKALASWYWRNITYYHCPSPREYYEGGAAEYVREYWGGLFAYGYGLCGTTHCQWTAEMNELLGHCQGRIVSVPGHSSFEAFLTSGGKVGNEYNGGRWVLLDHDISTVIFDDPADPARLLSLWEVAYSTPYPTETVRTDPDYMSIVDNAGAPDANRGWFISGLYYPSSDNSDPTSSDAMGYRVPSVVQPLCGYAGAPPISALKRGETFRRYLKPGLGGTTYCFWGAHMGSDGIPGPDRDRTWCNQPEQMYRTSADTPWMAGRGQYGNGVYTYVPDFTGTAYQEGVISETAGQVTFYFYSPYIIAATTPDTGNLYGVESAGGTDGLVVTGSSVGCTVQVSTDNGASWSSAQTLTNSLDLTDEAKGYHSYYLRFNAGPAALAGKNITITTVVMCNGRLMPHLSDSGSTVTYQASGKAVFAAGPTLEQAETFLTTAPFGSGSTETMVVPTPNGEPILEVHAVAWANSSAPPTACQYQIEYSTDGGSTWHYIEQDWEILPLGYPASFSETTLDWWSQSFCYGDIDISAASADEVHVRFSNNGGKAYRKCEVYLVYQTANDRDVDVTFNWTDGSGTHSDTYTYAAGQTSPDSSWTVATGTSTVTNWVEFEVKGDPYVTAPDVPSGPPIIAIGTPASFTTGGGVSSEGHALEYRFDFGDGTVSSWSSSTSASHTYAAAADSRDVMAQARSAVDHVESPWSATTSIIVETDGDGLPDAWEILYGLDHTSTDTDGDFLLDGNENEDGDQYTNLQEYANGTDPTVDDTPPPSAGSSGMSCTPGGGSAASALLALALAALARRRTGA